jgi:hypothetical protein
MGNYLGNEMYNFDGEKLKKQNILNIYACGNIEEIKKFEKLGIIDRGNNEGNFDEIDKPRICNWIPFEENFSENLLNKIISNIINSYKFQKDTNKISCNVVLISLDYDENNRQKIEWILNCLEKTSKIYKPIFMLAYKIKNTKNDKEKNEKENREKIQKNSENNRDKMDAEEEINKIENLNGENNNHKMDAKEETNKTENLNGEGKFESNNQIKIDQKEKKGNSKNNMSIEGNEEINDMNNTPYNIENKKKIVINFAEEMDNNKNTKKEFNTAANEANSDLSEINKYLESVYYKENEYSEIEKKLYSLYCYFNNISDVYSIINEMLEEEDNNKNKTNKIKYKATFNILVIGRPGGGKSTLINLLLNERKAREGIGSSVTKFFSKYVHSKYPITFVDTPGFENDNDLRKMISFLEQTKAFFDNGKNKFHLILYIINSSNERCFIGEEIKLIKHIYKNIKIPLFFVCTRAKNEDYALDFKEVIKINLLQNFKHEANLINNIYCCNLLNEKDGIYKRFGIDKLLNSIQNYYKEDINNLKNLRFFYNNALETTNNHNQIILNSLYNYNSFYEYLENLSHDIIENYKYLIKEEEEKRKKHEKNNTNNSIISNQIINEMLVKHLAFELDGDPSIIDINKIEPEVPTVVCNLMQPWDNYKTEDITVKGKKIKDEKIKKIIRKTDEIGQISKEKFLAMLSSKGFSNYLNEIICSYENAINSLSNLNKDIESSKNVIK